MNIVLRTIIERLLVVSQVCGVLAPLPSGGHLAG
jgi:hypothetical protein